MAKENIEHQAGSWNPINWLINYLDQNNKWMVARWVQTIFFEPKYALREVAALLKLGKTMLLYTKKPFNYYGLNPTELSEEQAKHEPIILLHGAGGNESNWLTMAQSFEKEHDGPVFTVNLVNGTWSEKDRETLEQKLIEIKHLYRVHSIYDVKTNLIGHSRGGTIAYYFSLQQDQWRVCEAENFLGFAEHIEQYTELRHRHDIGHVISIGMIFPRFHLYANRANKLHSVVSTKDQYTSEEKRLFAKRDRNSVLVEDLTHCELIANHGIFSQSLSWIKTPEAKVVSDGELSRIAREKCHIQ